MPNPKHASELQFVVDFAQMNLDDCDRKGLAAAALVFAAADLMLTKRDVADFTGFITRSPLAQLEKLQSNIRQLLQMSATAAAARDETVGAKVALPGIELIALISDAGDVWLKATGDPHDVFLYAALRTLERSGASRLKTCQAPECERIFVKVTRKEYCSTRCQSRIYMRSYQPRHQTGGRRNGQTRKG